jgi:chromosome segregation ATPase
MREQLEQRLKQLNAEFEAGQKMLAELEAKQAGVRETMLRISGAIQVLEEELATANQPAPVSTSATEGRDGRLGTLGSESTAESLKDAFSAAHRE